MLAQLRLFWKRLCPPLAPKSRKKIGATATLRPALARFGRSAIAMGESTGLLTDWLAGFNLAQPGVATGDRWHRDRPRALRP
jgi:hypothetical protein